MTDRRNGDPSNKSPKRDGPKTGAPEPAKGTRDGGPARTESPVERTGTPSAAPDPKAAAAADPKAAAAADPKAAAGPAPGSAKDESRNGPTGSAGTTKPGAAPAAGAMPPSTGAPPRSSAASAAAGGSRSETTPGATAPGAGEKQPAPATGSAAPAVAPTSGGATATPSADKSVRTAAGGSGAAAPATPPPGRIGSAPTSASPAPRPTPEAGKGGGAPPSTPRAGGGGGSGGSPTDTPPAPRKRRTGLRLLLGLIVLLLLLGGIGYLAVWPYYTTTRPYLERWELARFAEILRNPDVMVTGSELAARLEALERQVGDQAARTEATSAAPAGPAVPDDTADRLAALESSVAAAQEAARKALDEIEALKQTVAQQRQTTAPPATDGGDDAAVSALDGRLAALESKIEDLSAAPSGGGADPALGSRIDSLAGTVADNAQRLTSLSDGVAALRAADEARPAIDPARLTRIDDTVKSLSGRLDTTATEVGTVKSGLDRLESKVASTAASVEGLTDRITSQESGLSSTGAALETKIAGLAETVESVGAEVATLKAAVEAGTQNDSRRQAFALAVTQLGLALDSDRPYERPLSAVRQLLPDDETARSALTALEPTAATGVPTFAELRARFPAVASAAARGGPDGSGSVVDEALAEITALVSVRRTADAPADGRDAAINAAEAALESDDLAAAVAALEPLAGKGETVATWISDAKARLAAETALATLGDAAIAALDTGAR